MIDDNGKGQQEKEEARTKERNGKDIMHLKTKELGGKKMEMKGFLGLCLCLKMPNAGRYLFLENPFHSRLHKTKATSKSDSSGAQGKPTSPTEKVLNQ